MYASVACLQLKRRAWGVDQHRIQGGTVDDASGWPADVAEREREGLMRLPDREGPLCLGAQGDSDHPAPGSISFIWVELHMYIGRYMMRLYTYILVRETQSESSPRFCRFCQISRSANSTGDLFRDSVCSCGDGGGGVAVVLRVPPFPDRPTGERPLVDAVGGIRMRRDDEEDLGVTVVEEGREIDLRVIASGGGGRIAMRGVSWGGGGMMAMLGISWGGGGTPHWT
jgi:hypothetical protein